MSRLKISHTLHVGRATLSLLLFSFIFSCVQEEVLNDIQGNYSQPQLVIHSLISPGDSIFVSVAKTVFLGDTIESSPLTDANVVLANAQGDILHLSWIEDNYLTAIYGISQREFSIKPGETYTLMVTHAELPEVEATCTVPVMATPLTNVIYVGDSPMSGDGRLQYDVSVKWYSNGTYLHRLYFVAQYKEVKLSGDSVVNEGEFYYGLDPSHGIVKTDSLFTYQDAFLQETEYTPRVYRQDSTFYFDGNQTVPTQLTYQLATYLITPDEHMARYQESQDIFAQNRDALGSDSFIELYRGIIPEYTNIQGGLGVFGAYLRSEPIYLTLE